MTSVRLLLNLVEVIFNRRGEPATAEAYRALLARSLDACVSRLVAVEHSLPRLLPLGAPPPLWHADGGQGLLGSGFRE